jgi:tetratricopeptide (TPR) repeat protein
VINLKSNKMKNLFCFLIVFSVILFSQKTEAQATTSKIDTIKVALIKAQDLTAQGNIEEASRIYTGIMESDPYNMYAVQGWLIANMERTQDGEEKAIIQLEELGRMYPKNTAIIFFRAFLEAEYGHNEEALKDIDKLIKIQPDTALHYILKGQVLTAMKKFEEASKAFDRAISLDPKRPDVWGMKAGALLSAGTYDDAITSLNKVMELTPDDPPAIYNRACIYSLKGDKTNALSDLKKAISLNPLYKKYARSDEDFESLYEDNDFKILTMAESEVQISYFIQLNGKFKPDLVYIFIYPITDTADNMMLPEPVEILPTSELTSSFMIEPGLYTLGIAAWGYTSLRVPINFPKDEKDLNIEVILNPAFIGYGNVKDLNDIKTVSIRGDFNNFGEENEIPMKKTDTVWKPVHDPAILRGTRYMITVNGEHTIDLLNKNVSPIRRWNAIFNVYENNELVFDPSLYTLGKNVSEIQASWEIRPD